MNLDVSSLNRLADLNGNVQAQVQVKDKAKQGLFLKISVIANRVKGNWIKLGFFERLFRWIFSRIIFLRVESTEKKCYDLSIQALRKYLPSKTRSSHSTESTPTSPSQSGSAVSPPPAQVNESPKISPMPSLPQDQPLDPSIYGLKIAYVNQNTKFPNVDSETKQLVLMKTRKALSALVTGTFDQFKSLTTGGEELFKALREYIKFYPIKADSILTEMQKKEQFINPGEIAQTPVRMDYDESFIPIDPKPRNYFLMHSTPAPCGKHFGNLENDEIRKDYLAKMKATIAAGIEAQIDAGCKKVLWNYFGMGDFIRGAIKDRAKMYELRKDIAIQFFTAFDEILDSLSPERRKAFHLMITGPTGESFTPELQEEPRDNYNAFVFAAAKSRYKENIVFCPEKDAFVLAQEIVDIEYEGSDQMCPIGVINAGNSHKIGNHWYKGYNSDKSKFNANFAIDENGHRRSVSMAFFSYLINYIQKGNCKENIQVLISRI